MNKRRNSDLNLFFSSILYIACLVSHTHTHTSCFCLHAAKESPECFGRSEQGQVNSAGVVEEQLQQEGSGPPPLLALLGAPIDGGGGDVPSSESGQALGLRQEK